TLIIAVDATGKIYIERDTDKEPVAMTALQVQDYVTKVKRQVASTQVLIRADEAVPYGRVVVLMGGLNRSGVTDIGLITEAEDPEF
ncbi:MAG: ExbD/TolR family protein, partial [Oceanobacter sp.]